MFTATEGIEAGYNFRLLEAHFSCTTAEIKQEKPVSEDGYEDVDTLGTQVGERICLFTFSNWRTTSVPISGKNRLI